MKILFLGQLDEVGVKICNCLAEAHEVLAVAAQKSKYSLDCRCVTGKVDLLRISEEFRPGLLVYAEEKDADMNRVGAQLSQVLEQTGCRLLYIRERELACRRPQPVVIGGLLCREYAERYQTAVTLLEPSCLYGEDHLPQFFMDWTAEIRAHNTLTPHGAREEYCDCLHIDDFCAALEPIAAREDGGFETVALQSGYPFPLHRLTERFAQEFGQITVNAFEEEATEFETEPYRSADWSPSHSFLAELDAQLALAGELDTCLSRKKRGRAMGTALTLFAFAAVFILVEAYVRFITVSSDLQFVDMRLLFVVLASLVLGKKYGLGAAALCGAASVIQSLINGYQWYVLFYHVDNWIPIAVYFATAIGIGMYREVLLNKRKNDL